MGRHAFILSGCLVTGLLAGCDVGPKKDERGITQIESVSPRVERIRERGFVTLLTRNAGHTYYESAEGSAGYDYEMLASFADYLGVTVDVKAYDSTKEILDALEAGEGDIAAAGLTLTDERADRFLVGPEYYPVTQQLVCHRDTGADQWRLDDYLDKSIHVVAGSSYIDTLNALKPDYPPLEWQVHTDETTEELLAWVAEKKIDCVISDSNILSIMRRYFPVLKSRLELSEEQALVWYMAPDAKGLKQAADDWFLQFSELGDLDRLAEKYYEFYPIFDYVDLAVFKRRIRERLPKYREIFEEAAAKYDLNWKLLAAQSYQESHWNPKAKSPTGVRGMMMLTQSTAKRVGLKNRLDARGSIMGGAKHLRDLKNRLPETVREGDEKTLYALAAYNIGMGHLYDARNLARSLDKDPDDWLDMQEVLPLLSKKQYYRKLRYGYARGWEPVSYVSRIRQYSEILEYHFDDLPEETVAPEAVVSNSNSTLAPTTTSAKTTFTTTKTGAVGE